MQRRDFVKAVLAASVSAKSMLGQTAPTSVAPSAPPPALPKGPALPAPGPVPWTRGLMEVKPLSMNILTPDAVARTNAHFFSDEQLATLRQLCEVLLPPLKSYPGAIDAGTPEFLDFLLSVSPPDRQQMYTFGLNRLDAESKKRFGMPFDAVNASQADELIRPWLRTWMNDHPPAEPYEKFINLAHSDIRTATINSKAWSDANKSEGDRRSGVGLYWYPVDPDINRNYARGN